MPALTPRHSPRQLSQSALLRGVRELSARDRDLARVIQRYGPPPLWARRPGFATLVRIILEQQVSLASAEAAYGRLQSVAGRVTPRHVAATTEGRLREAGLTRQKAAYCHTLARALLAGTLDLAAIAQLSDEAVRAILLQLPGVGPWTADIYLLMALRRTDVWPVGDLALARAAQHIKRLRRLPNSEQLTRMARAWAPWRAVAARILWHSYLSNGRLT
ncbi:MAG: DNA-3-methyladenine glycosylase 2 family protein [Bacillati bacterium ANGP1]|uniref:DNA-3-methyladenine glycosylase II n=1 Tax=Candidatus Segetimicrobium genomatis TaxID=2569760 RepID=A0A537LLR2_9BACT|nr:MAG: DNA-3-methyladenine glycosylase 2 family protein [Terrabacteria group bacterium ANGP1]